MQIIARAFILSLFAAAALGALVVSNIQVQANTQTSANLAGSGGITTDGLIASALGGSVSGVGISISSNIATTVSVSISVDTGLFANVNVAGGISNVATVGLLAGLGGSLAISVQVTSSPPATISLTLNTPAITASGSAATTSSVQVHLLAGTNDVSATGTVYGAVAYSLSTNGQQITYTIPVNALSQLFLVAIDISATTSASSSASSSGSSNANNAGSNNFNYNGKFVPVAYNSNFNLAIGQQYAYGNNILVTPINSTGSSSTAAGTLNINYVGTLGSSSNSSAPNTAAYFQGYYQITGSANANNVLQWSADTSNSASVFVKGGAQITAQAFASTYASTATWMKSNTAAGAQASASSWQAVTSSRGVTASGKISVYANVNTYSQWTVSGNNAATAKAGLVLVVVAAVVALFF